MDTQAQALGMKDVGRQLAVAHAYAEQLDADKVHTLLLLIYFYFYFYCYCCC
jgi:hypothetical protein